MLPTVNPDLFKIEGGNVQVPQKLLEHAHADLHKANVTKVIQLPAGTFQIEARQMSTSHVSPNIQEKNSSALPCSGLLSSALACHD